VRVFVSNIFSWPFLLEKWLHWMYTNGLVGATRLLIGKYLGRFTPSICLWCREGWRQVFNIGHRSVIRAIWGLQGLGLGYVFFLFLSFWSSALSFVVAWAWIPCVLSILEGSGRGFCSEWQTWQRWLGASWLWIGLSWSVNKVESRPSNVVTRQIIFRLLFVSHNDTFKHGAVKTGHPIRKLLLSIMSRVLQMEFQDVVDHSSISWKDQSRADTWPFAVPIQISPIVPK
jgi:hypothetical protein